MKRYIMNGQLRKHCYRLEYMYLVQYLKLLHKTQKIGVIGPVPFSYVKTQTIFLPLSIFADALS